MSSTTAGLKVLSHVLGWVYFTAWSISFYPQAILNFRRKSVSGLSIDFATLNVLGHGSYALYNLGFFFNQSVRDDYRRRHHDHNSTVQPNDVAFACHAFTLASITLAQTYWYPRALGQTLSPYNRIIVPLAGLAAAINVFLFLSGAEHLIDFLYLLSYFKLYVSVAKYIPQAWVNYRRKSTVGWSIGNILLDLTGGTLSLIQLSIDAGLDHDWSAITGNPVKFGLSLLSIIFDLFFVLQHYVLYRDHTDPQLVSKSAAKVAEAVDEERGVVDERTTLI